jgi:exonuclease VII large subunit
LFDLLKRPGQDDQEVAKLLCDLVQSADGAEQQRDQLREIVVNAVNRIVNEREAVVREIVDKFSRDPEKWQRIRQTLVDHDDEALAVAIARVHANQADGFDRLAMSLLNKHFAECSDIEVGKLGGELGAILEAILRPPPPPPPSPGGGSSTTGRDATGPDGTSITEAPAAAFRRELTQLVARYRTELSSDELREIAASITAPQAEESCAEGAGG